MDRRDFLKDAAAALLVLPLGVFLLQCGDDKGGSTGATPTEADPTPPDAPPRVEGSNVFFTSSKTNEHSHTFTVPIAAFKAAPFGGVIGNTTPVEGHSHKLEISQEVLRRAGAGEIMKITSSKQKDHTHAFTIMKVE
jgi:hypothetical protein